MYSLAIQAVSNGSDKNLVKVVNSELIKGLKNGWIVEVTEPSRLRNQGVLVGLNNFDKAGNIKADPANFYSYSEEAEELSSVEGDR